MDVQTLLAEAKARFSYNSAKEALREKYSSKNLIAEQNGLWRADAATIGTLQSFDDEKIVLLDSNNNPVEVNRVSLLEKLKTLYKTTTEEYYKELKELENKR